MEGPQPARPPSKSPLEKMRDLEISQAARRAGINAQAPVLPEAAPAVTAPRRDRLDRIRRLATATWAMRRPDGEARKAAYRRHMIVVLHEATPVESYGPFHQIDCDWWVADGSMKVYRLDEVLEDLVARFAVDGRDDPKARDLYDLEHELAHQDLAIWRDGRLLAVLREGPGGIPRVSRFDR